MFHLPEVDDCTVHADGLMARLLSRLAADPATTGLALPRGFLIDAQRSGAILVGLGDTDHVTWSPNVQLDANWDWRDPDRVPEETIDELVEVAHIAIRHQAQDHAPERLPTWAVPCHPVALALALGHVPDRSIMPLGGRSHHHDPKRHWTRDGNGLAEQKGRIGTAVANSMMQRECLRFVSFGVLADMGDGRLASIQYADAGQAQIAMPIRPPATIMAAAPGLRLGDIVALAPSGSAEVDAAAADVVIDRVEESAGGVTFHLRPAKAIPYGVPPTDDLRRAMALEPEEI